MAFENILGLVSETDRQAFQEITARNPIIRQHAELGEQVLALKPRLDALKTDLPTSIKTLEDWNAWKDDEKDGWKGHQAEKVRLKTALAEATAKVAELEARMDTEMTPEEIREMITKHVTDQGIASTTAVDAAIAKAVKDTVVPMITDANNRMGNRFQAVYAGLTPKLQSHFGEFNETLDMAAVFEYAEKNNIRDANGNYDAIEAYNRFVQPKREEKRNLEHKKAVDDAKAEGIREGQRAAIAARSNPTDTGGGGLSVLQKFKQSKHGSGDDGGSGPAKLGTGEAARRGIQRFHEKQMAGTAE